MEVFNAVAGWAVLLLAATAGYSGWRGLFGIAALGAFFAALVAAVGAFTAAALGHQGQMLLRLGTAVVMALFIRAFEKAST